MDPPSPDAGLRSLVERARAGEPKARAALAERFADPVFRFLLFLSRDADAAGDMAQETFLRVFARLADLRSPDAFAGWLFAIARSVRREGARDARRGGISLEEVLDPSRGEEDPAATAELREDLDRLARALAALGERDREVIHLFHYAGLPADEVARAFGVVPDSARRMLREARGRLLGLFLEEKNQKIMRRDLP